MAFKGRKSRMLEDDNLVKKLEELVPRSTFCIWRKTEIPEPLRRRDRNSGSKRAFYENEAVLVVATTWTGEQSLGGQIPSGIAYNICFYRDDLDRNQEREFNKDTRWVFRAIDDKVYNYTYFDDEHSIAAQATATSMAWLDKSFGLPEEDSGPITLLDEYGTQYGDCE